MDSKIKTAAGAALVPRVLSGFRLRWLVYGAAAYYGLKYLNKRGILPNQTATALSWIDQGLDFAKNQIGLKTNNFPSAARKTAKQTADSLEAH